MPSTSETGHAKNVANFEDLISFCNGYGATYNPSKDAPYPLQNEIKSSKLATFLACPVSDVDGIALIF